MLVAYDTYFFSESPDATVNHCIGENTYHCLRTSHYYSYSFSNNQQDYDVITLIITNIRIVHFQETQQKSTMLHYTKTESCDTQRNDKRESNMLRTKFCSVFIKI